MCVGFWKQFLFYEERENSPDAAFIMCEQVKKYILLRCSLNYQFLRKISLWLLSTSSFFSSRVFVISDCVLQLVLLVAVSSFCWRTYAIYIVVMLPVLNLLSLGSICCVQPAAHWVQAVFC